MSRKSKIDPIVKVKIVEQYLHPESRYDGEDMSLISIYNKNKKRRAKSKYLLSVMVDVVKDRDIIPAKVVYVRNRNKRKESLCLISTDVNAKATLT